MNPKGIPYTEAAEQTTVSGWVCKTCRRFYGENEHLARWCCASQIACQTSGCAGKVDHSGYSICNRCREKLDHERYLKLPEADWDGETPLCLHDDDTYFYSVEDLHQYAEDHETKVEDLWLIICRKQRLPYFEMNSLAEDHLADGQDLPDPSEIEKAVNDWIEKNFPDVWEPGKTRPTVASLMKWSA